MVILNDLITAANGSPFPIAILTLIVFGMVIYGKFHVLPRINEKEDENRILRETIDSLNETISGLQIENKELVDANIELEKSSNGNELAAVIVELDKKLQEISTSCKDSGRSQNLAEVLLLIKTTLDKINEIEKVIMKHPSNLEAEIMELSRVVKDIDEGVTQLSQSTNTLASSLMVSTTQNNRVQFQELK